MKLNLDYYIMEQKNKYTLKEALEIIAKHMKDLANKPKVNSESEEKSESAEKK